MHYTKENVAANITALRNSQKLTQSELAERLNYTDKAVSKWERAESIPDVFVLKQLADIFDVTVDYLLEPHDKTPQMYKDENKRLSRNRTIISVLSILPAWLVAFLIYVSGTAATGSSRYFWLAFIAAVPVSAIILIIFNSIWHRKKVNFVCITVLLWSMLLLLYLIFLSQNIWLIFTIGIPGQIAIILWARLDLSD